MRIKCGDVVKVISGNKKIKGVIGKIISVDRNAQRVVIENGPQNKRHMKPERSRKHPEGGIIERPGSIHISNVMLMNESSERPVRVGYTFEDGKKIRIAKGRSCSGERI